MDRKRRFGGKRYLLAVPLIFFLLLGDTQAIMQKENTRIYKVFCIGDSITYGKGVPEERREEECYPAVLGKLLGRRYEVMNYGASGRTLLDIPGKSYRDTGYIEAVKGELPDIVIIMLGSNDSRSDRWHAKKYKQAYIALLKELQMIESKPAIYIMTPPEAFPRESGEIIHGIRNEIIHDEIGRIVREVAEETGVGLIDLYAVTENHPEYFFDGVHPNKEGYEVVAQTVYEHIVKKEF